MAMKKFEISITKYGNCGNSRHTFKIEATSPKMAIKKFYNEKNFGDTRTRKQWMEYEQEMNGITYSEPEVREI